MHLFCKTIALALHKTSTILQVFEQVLQSISGNKYLHLQLWMLFYIHDDVQFGKI